MADPKNNETEETIKEIINESIDETVNEEKHNFIKETIKEYPPDREVIVRYFTIAIILVAVIYLCVAAAVLLISFSEKKKLSNETDVRYIGVEAETVSEKTSADKRIPQGIYVKSVDEGSPAMTAGLQNGDIIHRLDDQEVEDKKSYEAVLQSLPLGKSVKIRVYRQNPSGEFVDVEFEITIKSE